MNMGTINANSVSTVNQVNRTKPVSRTANYSFVNHLVGSNLEENHKKNLLLELTGKHKTMVEGVAFMLKHRSLKFNDFDRAMSLLNQANNSYSLTAVEAALQTQINVIRDMSTSVISQENKSLCLYTLQNMIFALSDYHLKNGKENDYVPKILQDQYQMLLKGSVAKLDWEQLNESVYSSEYKQADHPTLGKWKFLDDKLIKKNMDQMLRYQSMNDETLINRLYANSDKSFDLDAEIINWGNVELIQANDDEINQILESALTKFNAENAKNNINEIFNLVKNSLTEKSIEKNLSNYPSLQKITSTVMQRIVEVGSQQQHKTMMKQNQQAERSL